MVGKMQRTLEQLLSLSGKVSHHTLQFPKINDFVQSPALKQEIELVFKKLGGILPIPLNLRHWDLEFDEELHFNGYRGITLQSDAYRFLPRFPLDLYKSYCSDYQDSCLRRSHGGYWTNRSCEAQFGPASPLKDITGNGAPRWKQRAFYDFVKDLSNLLVGVKVVRVAIWDRLRAGGTTTTVKELLASLIDGSAHAAFCEASSTALAAIVKARAAD